MKALKAIGGFIVGAASVFGAALQVLEYAGVPFNGAIAGLAGSSRIWLPVASLLLGIMLGYAARGLAERKTATPRRTREDSRREKELERQREEESERRLRASIKQLEPSMKALMKVAVEKGEAFSTKDDWGSSFIVREPFISQFLEAEYIDNGLARITATPILESVVSEMPDLFSSVSATISQHAREKGDSRRFSSFSTEMTPNWWWHR